MERRENNNKIYFCPFNSRLRAAAVDHRYAFGPSYTEFGTFWQEYGSSTTRAKHTHSQYPSIDFPFCTTFYVLLVVEATGPTWLDFARPARVGGFRTPNSTISRLAFLQTKPFPIKGASSSYTNTTLFPVSLAFITQCQRELFLPSSITLLLIRVRTAVLHPAHPRNDKPRH